MRLLGLLSGYFGSRIIFGGSVLNYVYMVHAGEPPRLTFDLDASWHRSVRGKRSLLGEMLGFNKWLHETGNTLSVPVSATSGSVELYVIEYDAEKDHFPPPLSLRMPVITRYDGRPFYEFLGIRERSVIARLRSVFEEILGVRDARIDYVRFEVSLEPVGPGVEETLLDAFGFAHRAVVTPLEHQLASKIAYKLGKDFGDDLRHNVHDILKAVLDLRLLDHSDQAGVAEALQEASIATSAVDRNLGAVLAEGRRLWERNYHYALVRRRYTLDEIVARVRRNLQELL